MRRTHFGLRLLGAPGVSGFADWGARFATPGRGLAVPRRRRPRAHRPRKALVGRDRSRRPTRSAVPGTLRRYPTRLWADASPCPYSGLHRPIRAFTPLLPIGRVERAAARHRREAAAGRSTRPGRSSVPRALDSSVSSRGVWLVLLHSGRQRLAAHSRRRDAPSAAVLGAARDSTPASRRGPAGRGGGPRRAPAAPRLTSEAGGVRLAVARALFHPFRSSPPRGLESVTKNRRACRRSR